MQVITDDQLIYQTHARVRTHTHTHSPIPTQLGPSSSSVPRSLSPRSLAPSLASSLPHTPKTCDTKAHAVCHIMQHSAIQFKQWHL